MNPIERFLPFWQDSSNKAKLDIGNKILVFLKEKDQTQAELMQDPGTGDIGSFIFHELSLVGLIKLDGITGRYFLTRKGLDYLGSVN